MFSVSMDENKILTVNGAEKGIVPLPMSGYESS